MSDYDDLDLEFGLDEDVDLDLDELGFDEDDDLNVDELGLEEDAEFGDEDEPDPDDDMEDLKAVSDDPEDPEDDSGPDINGDQFGVVGLLAAGGIAAASAGLWTGGLILARRARYTRQQRIYRNRYKRALKRADWRRGGAGVRRRLKKTYLRMKRLWSKLNEKRRAGLKNPAATRKAVRKALGPLPGSKGVGRRAGGSVYPRAGIAAGLVRPEGGAGAYPQAPGLPPLSQFQRQEIAQQSVATNYAQRFSAPPVRESYTMGLPPFAPEESATVPAPMGTALDALNSYTNERLQRISEGGGVGVYGSPVMRVRARQILRSRGALASAPVISAGGRPLVGPAAPGRSVVPSTYFWGQKRESLPGSIPFDRPLMPLRPVQPRAPMQTPGLLRGPLGPNLRPGVAVLPGPAIPRPSLPSTAFRPQVERPGLPVGTLQPAIQRPSLPSTPFRSQVERPGLPVGTLQPAIQRPSFDPRVSIRPAIQPGLGLGPLRSPLGVKTPPAPTAFPSLSPPPAMARPRPVIPVVKGPFSRMGFDTYGQEIPVLPVAAPPDGYSVVPDFTTLGLSAIKEHPIKTAVSVAGLLAAGVFLVKPAVNLIRKASY